MGWTFPYATETREELVEYLRRPTRYGENNTLLKSSVVGNNHWYLVKNHASGLTVIGLDLMQGGPRSDPGWGYKDLDESAGPNEVNCPITYLKLASAPTGYAIEWRKKVLEHHAQKAAKAELAVGSVVEYGGSKYRLLHKEAQRGRGWSVRRLGEPGGQDGGIYRMKAHQLNAGVIVSI